MIMYLNSIKPAIGSKRNRLRVGRGIGSGIGKTCGRGHKGQKSRSGGFHKVGFEGGQMPIQRRLPKRGFKILGSREYPKLRLSDLDSVAENEIDLSILIKNEIIPDNTSKVKIYLSGNCKKNLKIKDIRVSAGAKKIIEENGGSVF